MSGDGVDGAPEIKKANASVQVFSPIYPLCCSQNTWAFSHCRPCVLFACAVVFETNTSTSLSHGHSTTLEPISGPLIGNHELRQCETVWKVYSVWEQVGEGSLHSVLDAVDSNAPYRATPSFAVLVPVWERFRSLRSARRTPIASWSRSRNSGPTRWCSHTTQC